VYLFGFVIAKALIAGFKQRPIFDPKSGRVEFIEEKVAMGKLFSDYFRFPRKFSFHRLLHTHYHLSSIDSTIDQIVADVPSGLSLTPARKKLINKYVFIYIVCPTMLSVTQTI
jgi:hypothetical protein